MKFRNYRMAVLTLFAIFLTATVSGADIYDGDSQYKPYAPDGIPFTVAEKPWLVDSLGNHRAVVRVSGVVTAGSVVRVDLPWRRPDLNPESKDIRVYSEKGRRVAEVAVSAFSAERAQIEFTPVDGNGLYYVYYMPFKMRVGSFDARYEPQWNDYFAPGFRTVSGDKSQGAVNATVERFEARSRFEFFTQMGNIATHEEEQKLKEAHAETPLLFTEDRAFPIRLTRHLPVRWVKRGPSSHFEGTAQRNEYYVWQIGVWAVDKPLNHVRLRFSDLKLQGGTAAIGCSQMTCFNQEGTSWDGNPLHLTVNVPQNRVQALWCGVQIPQEAVAGTYQGTVTVEADGIKSRQVDITLHVSGELLADHGDNDLWRMSRLRWLNSRIGTDDHPVAPYMAMKVKGRKITATEKQVRLDGNGLPRSIRLNGREVLSRPLDIVVETEEKKIRFNADNVQTKLRADGLVEWSASGADSDIAFTCDGYMEYDGFMRYRVKIGTVSGKETVVKDIRLETAYTPYASAYFMGVGYGGGKCPDSHSWNWQGPYDSYWMGNAEAGLHIEFRGGEYHGPLLKDYHPQPPVFWANDGKGTIGMKKTKGTAGAAEVVASTGETILDASGKTMEFDLLITPVKPVDTRKQFAMRFFHANYRDFDKAAQEGANIINLHHAGPLNPVINYPFIVRDSLKAFISHEHDEGRKVKLYYTIRELTNHVAEIYALKSLGGEIIAPGTANGAPWLCEHLIEDYRPAWYVSLQDDQTADAAFVQTGFSRWINYYLEGLDWMMRNYKLDGLYMDDVAFDRNVMKRIRKILMHYNPEALVDLHSNTAYSIGPANQYTDFFPYLDRLWFGEWFKYNEMSSDEWFVTFSGIPFGPMSEMLQDGGNPYLGAVYGATGRHSYGSDPAPMWKIWKEFGIEDARMSGYWDEDCPVSVITQEDVKATAFVKKGKVMIAIGNFGNKDCEVKLQFDWKKLKLSAGKAKLYAPEIVRFQKQRSFGLSEAIPVQAKKGWVLILE